MYYAVQSISDFLSVRYGTVLPYVYIHTVEGKFYLAVERCIYGVAKIFGDLIRPTCTVVLHSQCIQCLLCVYVCVCEREIEKTKSCLTIRSSYVFMYL